MYSAVGVWTSENLIKGPVKNVQLDEEIRADVDLKVSLKKLKTLSRKQPSQASHAKVAISQGLVYAPKLYHMGTSKIKNKKIQKLLKSEMAKRLLNKELDKTYSKLLMEVEGFENRKLKSKIIFENKGKNLQIWSEFYQLIKE